MVIYEDVKVKATLYRVFNSTKWKKAFNVIVQVMLNSLLKRDLTSY